MQSEKKQVKAVLQKLSEISEIYKENSSDASGVRKEFYQHLISTISLILAKIKIVQDAKQKIDPNNDSTETDPVNLEIPEDENVFSKFKYHNFGLDELSERFLKHLCGFIHLYITDDIFDAPVKFLAEIIFHNVLWWQFGNYASLRCNNGKTETEILTYAISLKELGIPYMSDRLWDILKKRQIDGKICFSETELDDITSQQTVWIQLFNNQEKHNTIFTISKELGIAINYIYDPVVEKFFEKKLDAIFEYGKIFTKKLELIAQNHTQYESELCYISPEIQRRIAYSEFKLIKMTTKYCDLTKVIEGKIHKATLQKSDIKKIAENTVRYLTKTNQLDVLSKLDPNKAISESFSLILERILKLHNKNLVKSLFSNIFAGFEQIHTSFCEEKNNEVDIKKISKWCVYLLTYAKKMKAKDQQPSV